MSNPDPFALTCLAVALLAVLWGFAAERSKDAAMEWLRIANANTTAAVEKNDELHDQIEQLGLSLDAARRENAGLAMELAGARRDLDKAAEAIARRDHALAEVYGPSEADPDAACDVTVLATEEVVEAVIEADLQLLVEMTGVGDAELVAFEAN